MKKIFTKSFLILVAILVAQSYVFAQSFASKQTAKMTDEFSVTFVATPSHDSMDGAVGLSEVEFIAAETWNYGPYIHFNTSGEIEARDSVSFTAENTLAYTAGIAYKIEITGNVKTQTYSATVTPDGGTATVIATDYKFRHKGSTPAVSESLNYLSMTAGQLETWGGIPGSTIGVSFMDDPFVEDPYPSDGNSSWALNVCNNEAFDAQTGAFSATFDVTPVGDSADCAIGLTQDVSAIGGYSNYSAYVIFEKGGLIGVGKGGTSGWPTQDKPAYIRGTTYAVTLDVDVEAGTYSATVSGGDLVDRVLITDHDFRKQGVTELKNLATQIAVGGAWGGKPGDIEVNNFSITQGIVQDSAFASKQTAKMTDEFSVTFVATPSHDSMDGAVGLSEVEFIAAETWNYGPYIHFNTSGEIEARDSVSFTAENTLAYTAGIAYKIEITGNVKTQTYSATVTPDGGTATVIATDYKFRHKGSTPAVSESLNYLSMTAGQLETWGGIPGSTIGVSFMDDPFVEDPYPSDGNSSWALNVCNNEAFDAQTGAFSATFDVTPVGDSADCAIGLTQDVSAIGGYSNYSAYVIFEKGGLIGVGKGGTSGWPTQDKPAYIRGTTYAVTLDVDVEAGTYSATVSGGDLVDRVLITDHDFRKQGVTELKNLATQIAVGGSWGGKPGDIEVSNINIGDSVVEDHDDWKQITTTVQPAGRGYGEMAPLGNGKALIFGGNTERYSGNVDDNTWVYDTETDAWTDMAPTGDVPPLRGRHGMAYAGDDKAIVFGGQSDAAASGFLGDTWIYDLSDNAWTQSASAPAALYERMEPAMAYIGDDKILMFAGNDAAGDMNDTWVYDVSDDTWTELFALGAAGQPSAMIAAMAYAGDDKVLLYGKQSETWVYDLSDNTWTEMTTTNTPGVDGHGMAYLGDENVLLYGGYNAEFARESKTWIYNLEANTWIEETPETTPPTGNFIVTMCETSVNGSSNIVCFGGRGIGGNAMDVTFEFGGADWPLDNPPVSVRAVYSPEFNIYPNPVQDKLNISFDEEIQFVEVFNLAGVKLMVKQVTDINRTTLNVSELPQGMYILNVATKEGRGSKMFIKQ
ncbi:MAG: kelch repeat-containing protein [Bacteroidota bacterium]